jgi:hypothetical protein
MDATGQIIGHADVEGSVFPAGKDVNPVSHQFALPRMGPGNKSRNDIRRRSPVMTNEGPEDDK